MNKGMARSVATNHSAPRCTRWTAFSFLCGIICSSAIFVSLSYARPAELHHTEHELQSVAPSFAVTTAVVQPIAVPPVHVRSALERTALSKPRLTVARSSALDSGAALPSPSPPGLFLAPSAPEAAAAIYSGLPSALEPSPLASVEEGSDVDCAAPSHLLALLPSKDDIVAALNNFDSAIEPWPPAFKCEPMASYGGSSFKKKHDGQKLICGLEETSAPCTVYSLGSRLDFSFERAISKASPCDIVTIDCTVDEKKAQKILPPRTTFFPLCIGSSSHGSAYVSLPELMQRAGHDRIDLLKMDIEGFETYVVQSLLAQPRQSRLPYQINIETHGGHPTAWVNRALLTLGYVPVSKEQNEIWRTGWEWTWVRAFCDLSEHVDISQMHPRQKLLGPDEKAIDVGGWQ